MVGDGRGELDAGALSQSEGGAEKQLEEVGAFGSTPSSRRMGVH